MVEGKNLPEKKFRAGSVTATIWKNKGNRNGRETEFHTVGLERSYKKDDEWKSTHSLRVCDFADVELVLRKSYEYLRLRESGQQSSNIEEEAVM